MKSLRRVPMVGWFALALALQILRRPALGLQFWHSQFWAEDGSIFFAQDFASGPASFMRTYAGYLHLWPRIVAFVLGFLPLLWGPFLYRAAALLSCIVLFGVIANRRFPANRLQKALMILLVSWVPGGGEIYLNLTNTISICCLAMIAVCLLGPEKKPVSMAWESLLLLICACSGPFVFVVLPAVLLYYFLLPEWKKAIFQRLHRIAAMVLGALVQLANLTLSERGPSGFDPHLSSWTHALANFFKPLFFANVTVPGELYGGVAFLSFALVLGVVISGMRKGGFTRPAFLLLCAFAVFASCLFASRAFPAYMDPYRFEERYYFVPYVLIYWALVTELDRGPETRLFSAIAPAVAGGLLTVGVLTSAFFFQARESLPNYDWAEQVSAFKGREAMDFRILPQNWRMFLDHRQCWRCR